MTHTDLQGLLEGAILPCRFCGGEAALTGTSVWRNGAQKKLAVCRDCGASADAALWNKGRADLAAKDARIAALTEAVVEAADYIEQTGRVGFYDEGGASELSAELRARALHQSPEEKALRAHPTAAGDGG